MYGWGLEYCANYWLIRSPRFIQFICLYIMLYLFILITSQVLGHLVTYSILAYLIAALVVYFRLLPSARDRKDQLVSIFNFAMCMEIIIWRLMEVDNTLLICRSSCCLSWSPPSSSTSWEGSSPGGTTGLMHCIQANFDDCSILRPSLLIGHWSILILMTGSGKLQRVTAS